MSVLDSNMNEKPEMPHRFREESFRFYEPFINDIVVPWPKEVKKFYPNHYNRAQATFACRLRDAMKSLRDNKWSTSVDMAKFLEAYPLIVVSERTDGTVLCGPKDAIASYVNLSSNDIPQSMPLNTDADETFIVDLSKPAKEVIAELSQARKIVPRLLLVGITDTDVDALSKSYDVAIDKKDEHTYILI